MMKIYAIDELRMYDLPRHSKSTATFISDLLTFVDELINKKKSVDPIPFIQKSAIEKPANNPYKNLPDVACQDTIRLSQAKIVELKSPGRAQRLNLVLQRSRGNKTKAKMLVALQLV